MYKIFQIFFISSRNLPKFYLKFLLCFINMLEAFTEVTKKILIFIKSSLMF